MKASLQSSVSETPTRILDSVKSNENGISLEPDSDNNPSKLKNLFSSGVNLSSFKYLNSFFGAGLEGFESFEDPLELSNEESQLYGPDDREIAIMNDENENEINQNASNYENEDPKFEFTTTKDQLSISISSQLSSYQIQDKSGIKFDEKLINNKNQSKNNAAKQKQKQSNGKSLQRSFKHSFSKKPIDHFIEELPPMIPWGRFKGCYDTRQYKCYRKECHKYKNQQCGYCNYLPIMSSGLRVSVSASDLVLTEINDENVDVADDDENDEFFSFNYNEASSFRRGEFNNENQPSNSVLNDFIGADKGKAFHQVSDSDSSDSEDDYSYSNFFTTKSSDFTSTLGSKYNSTETDKVGVQVSEVPLIESVRDSISDSLENEESCIDMLTEYIENFKPFQVRKSKGFFSHSRLKKRKNVLSSKQYDLSDNANPIVSESKSVFKEKIKSAITSINLNQNSY